MRRALIGAMTVAALAAWPRHAGAQPQTVGPEQPLARFITDLIASAGRIDTSHTAGGTVTGIDERSDFLVASTLAGTPMQLNQALGLQLTTFPFNLGLDASKPGSEFVPGHSGFAPAFTVHAGSMGSGHVSVAFDYQNTSFGSFAGTALDSGNLGIILKPPPSVQAAFGRDVLHESLSLRLQTDTATFGIVYGATDRLDVGVAIPIVHIDAEGVVQSQVYRAAGAATTDRYFFDVYPASPTPTVGCSVSSIDVPNFNRLGGDPNLQPITARAAMVELVNRTVARRCAASGIGDVVLHTRWRLGPFDTQDLAAGVDVRLPTGNKDKLLGTGATRATAALVWSAREGRFRPHANVGYTVSRGNSSSFFNSLPDGSPSPSPLDLKVPDELDLAFGTDIVFFRRLTTGVDVFARKIQNLRRFRVDDTTAAALTPGDPPVPGTLLSSEALGTTVVVGVASAQVSLTDRTLLMGHLMFPLGGSGLRPHVGISAGLGVRY